MNKKTKYFLMIVALVFSFAGFASLSLADINHSPAIVGVVTEINGTKLTLIARDDNTYSVDASEAKVVRGFLGFWAKPSAFANIQVTDTLTVKGEIKGDLIIATDIAHNKTPQNSISKMPQTQNISVVPKSELVPKGESAQDGQSASQNTASSSTTLDSIKNIVNNVVGIFGTSTDISTTTSASTTSSTTEDVTLVEKNLNPNDQMNASTIEKASIVETVVNAVSNTVQNVVNAVTGGGEGSTTTQEN